MLSESLLRKMMPLAGTRLDPHLPFIGPAMEKGDIATPVRIAAFMAHLAHESGEYRWLQEIWGPTEAQAGYEGRADLGNAQPGDGRKFAGVGPIQVTGRANITACGAWLGIDTAKDPLLLAKPQYATASAVWFWTVGNGKIDLNLLADRAWFVAMTRVINGGTNGLAARIAYWARNRALLGLPPINTAEEQLQVMKFQQHHGLLDDGIAGPKTLAVVKSLPSYATGGFVSGGQCYLVGERAG